jgi:hypothetical protein
MFKILLLILIFPLYASDEVQWEKEEQLRRQAQLTTAHQLSDKIGQLRPRSGSAPSGTPLEIPGYTDLWYAGGNYYYWRQYPGQQEFNIYVPAIRHALLNAWKSI